MPFVNPPLLGSSIFLYRSEDDAEKGANWGGSGLLVGVESEVNTSRVYLYAVTNDHVATRCPVIRIVNSKSDAFVLSGVDSDWESHPNGDDVAIRALGAVPKGDYFYVRDDLLLSKADLSPEDYPHQVSPGDDCLMVGRYINSEHRQFDRPVLRFGNLAMLPEFVYQDLRSFDQESFLVEMRSHAGFSGSPVYVYYEEPGWRSVWIPDKPEPDVTGLAPEQAARVVAQAQNKHRQAVIDATLARNTSGMMGKTWLLGVDWGHLPVWDDVFDGNAKVGRMRVSTGMAAVVPAWKITELLNTKGARMTRDKTERHLAKQPEGAAALDVNEDDEFARFEDLTQKLVQVPKRELVEKRKEQAD